MPCSLALLLTVRLYWGWQFWQTGWGKLSNIAKPIDYLPNFKFLFPPSTRISSAPWNLAAEFCSR
jgi:uncharacterized membrane protein YphA (DoxX/SURF4 family)